MAWRVAELRVEGEPAQVGAFQRIVPEGKHVHGYAFVCVIRGDGRLEQPERAEHWNKKPAAATDSMGLHSFEELVQACKNVGVDLSCGACAALFYTGSEHPGAPGSRARAFEHTCGKPNAPEIDPFSPPSRCRIVVEGDHWGCLSAGCGAEGAVEGGRLVYVEPRKVTTIAVADATGPHPYVEGEICLFDRPPAQEIAGAKPPQRITFCGQQVDVACDRRCDKAWGRDSRPRKQLSDNPDDYVFVSDGELGTAPFPSDSTEGDQGKPSGTSHQGPLNKWCVRECERSVMVDAGQPITLPDFDHPQPNIRKRP